MTPALWGQIVGKWANVDRIVPADAQPTAAACRAAHALYYLSAPFSLRGGDIASSVRPDGRVLGRTHAVVVNCITEATVFEHSIDLISGAPDDNGDTDASPAGSWNAPATAALARVPLPFGGIARIALVRAPLAYVNAPDPPGSADGAYRLFAHADGSRAEPSILPIVDVNGKRVTVLIQSAVLPQPGDYVEFVRTATQ